MELKPAHEVVVNLFRDAVGGLSTAYKNKKLDQKRINVFTGRLLSAIYILRRMAIPQKHIQEVAEKLRAIDIPREVKEKIIVRRLLTHIVDDNLAHAAAQASAKSTNSTGAAKLTTHITTSTIAGPAV